MHQIHFLNATHYMKQIVVLLCRKDQQCLARNIVSPPLQCVEIEQIAGESSTNSIRVSAASSLENAKFVQSSR